MIPECHVCNYDPLVAILFILSNLSMCTWNLVTMQAHCIPDVCDLAQIKTHLTNPCASCESFLATDFILLPLHYIVYFPLDIQADYHNI